MTVDVDPEASADDAGLRYMTDAQPGVRRRRAGRGFVYIGPDGTRIRDRDRLAWFKRLAVPPAWTDVWISPVKHGHLQATGRDARGRKQYRYHPRWREVRDAAKYERLIDFARALPRIRRRTDRDLRRRGMPQEKVLAAIVRLLEATLIRVGNEEYARENRSYGLSTLRDRHVEVNGARLRFSFRGKARRDHDIDISDARLARVVGRCQELPGQTLFQYIDDDGKRSAVGSEDVNDYLRETTGEPFTSKDFRTWAGTVAAALALQELSAVTSATDVRGNVVAAVERVAAQLGNTPAVCRRCYVHPELITAYLDGTMADALARRTERRLRRGAHALQPQEAAVLGLLTARLARERRRRRHAA